MKRSRLYLAVALLLVAAGLAAFLLGRIAKPGLDDLAGTALQNPVDVSDVSLTSDDGETFTFGALEDAVTLVFFGFTNCPDVCPLTLSRLGETYRTLGEPDDLQVVFITVDPDDSPEQTQQYAAAFHPSFIGLSGTNSELTATLKRFFAAANSLGNRQFAHTDAVYVVNEQGQVTWLYGDDDLSTLDDDLPKLLRQG